jgi:hypothetical protein
MRYLLGFLTLAGLGAWVLLGTAFGAAITTGLAAGTLFAFMTWPFLVLLALFLAIEFACVENESGVGATFTLLCFAAILYFFGGGVDNTVIRFVIDNWLLLVLAYFPIGAVWMFLKWESILKKWDTDLAETKKAFVEQEGLTLAPGQAIPAEHKGAWFRYAGHAARKPDPNSYKSRFLLWIGYWPFSMAWSVTRQFFIRLFSLLDDLARAVRRVSLVVYERCSGALRYMVDRRANKYDDDVK